MLSKLGRFRNLNNDRYSDLQNVGSGDKIFAAAIIPAMGVILGYFVISNQITVEEHQVKSDLAAKAGLERYVRLIGNNAAAIVADYITATSGNNVSTDTAKRNDDCVIF